MRLDRGFAAIAAIFIIVVLAGLGVAMVAIFGGQQRSQAFDTLGMRAYQAAHTGLEIGTNLTIRNGACPSNTPFQLSAAPQLSDFWVKIDCVPPTDHSDSDGTIKLFQLTVTACNNATCPGTAADNYIERQLRATICRGATC